jgi:hypothetical protein
MRRSTLILLILFALLGALAWYMQQPENAIKKALATSTSTPSIASELLISPEKGPIAQISIQDAAGKTVRIDKTSGQWIVKTDQDQPADPSLAESAAGQALNLLIIKKLDTAPDPVGTGLDKPVYTISLNLADGSTFTFKIGKATVTDSGYYTAGPDGAVYILSKSEVDALTYYFDAPPLPPAIEGTATSSP